MRDYRIPRQLTTWYPGHRARLDKISLFSWPVVLSFSAHNFAPISLFIFNLEWNHFPQDLIRKKKQKQVQKNIFDANTVEQVLNLESQKWKERGRDCYIHYRQCPQVIVLFVSKKSLTIPWLKGCRVTLVSKTETYLFCFSWLKYLLILLAEFYFLQLLILLNILLAKFIKA